MKLIKEEIVNDKEGKKIKKIYKIQGRKVEEILLVEPSQWYEDNVMKPNQILSEKEREYEENQLKIARKMREMAKKELEKEKL